MIRCIPRRRGRRRRAAQRPGALDDDEDDAADPQSAYVYWEDDGAWQDFTSYIVVE